VEEYYLHKSDLLQLGEFITVNEEILA